MIIKQDGIAILNISRKIRKSNDHASFDFDEVKTVIINQYQSIDIDKLNRSFTIVINSNIIYNISCKDAEATVNSLIKAWLRDEQINKIIA